MEIGLDFLSACCPREKLTEIKLAILETECSRFVHDAVVMLIVCSYK